MPHSLWGGGLVLAADPHELLVVFDSVGYRHLTPAALSIGLLRLGGGELRTLPAKQPPDPVPG